MCQKFSNQHEEGNISDWNVSLRLKVTMKSMKLVIPYLFPDISRKCPYPNMIRMVNCPYHIQSSSLPTDIMKMNLSNEMKWYRISWISRSN